MNFDTSTGELRQVHLDLCRLSPQRMKEPLTPTEIKHIALFREELTSMGLVILHKTDNKLHPYEVWFGDDIVKAAQIAELNSVWAIVGSFKPMHKEIIKYKVDDTSTRQDQPVDVKADMFQEAKDLRETISSNGWSDLYAAKALGLPRQKLRNILLLNNLDESVKSDVQDGLLEKSHAIRLAALSKNQQIKLSKSIRNSQRAISVRDLENFISGKISHEQLFDSAGEAATSKLESHIANQIGLTVKLNYQTRERGVIILRCNNRNMLLDYIEILGRTGDRLLRFSVSAKNSTEGNSDILIHFGSKDEFNYIMKMMEVDLHGL